MRKVLKIKYNSQRDNIAFKNLQGYDQCAYTSAAMLLSHFIPAYSQDALIGEMIKEVEPIYGSGSIGQIVLAKLPGLKNKRIGAFGDSWPIIIDAILKSHKIKKTAKFIPHSGTDEDIIKAIDSGSPCLLSTMLSSKGHYVLIVGYIKNAKGIINAFIVHDPYGKVLTGYKDINGAFCEIPWSTLAIAAEASSKIATGKKGYRFTWVS